jgi:hypothetical protein
LVVKTLCSRLAFISFVNITGSLFFCFRGPWREREVRGREGRGGQGRAGEERGDREDAHQHFHRQTWLGRKRGAGGGGGSTPHQVTMATYTQDPRDPKSKMAA